MENAVVGSEACLVSNVWAILSKSYVIKQKWSDFAEYLRLPSEEIDKLRLDQLHDKIKRNGILKKVLILWVAHQGDNAKLTELLRVVEDECGDNYVGERLRLANNLPLKTLQNDSASWENPSSSTYRDDVNQNVSKSCFQILNGTEYCSVHDVWTALSESNVIKEKWSDFAGFLQIPIEDIERFREELILKKANRNDILKKILKLWVSYKARDAQLAKIVEVVEDKCGDNSIGEKLRLVHNLVSKNFRNSTNWTALSPAFQEKVVERISMYFPHIPPNSFKSKLQGDILFDLMTGKIPKLFRSTTLHRPKFYLQRTLFPRHIISEKVFYADAPDIFLFTGLDEFELGKLIKAHDTSTSDEQLDSSEIHVRFLVLKSKSHFQKICKKAKPNTPVHVLSYDKNSEKIKWVQTHGRISILQRFVDNCQILLMEESFLESLGNQNSSPIIISDSPGMGKSFLLSNIALKLETFTDKIVIFTSAKDFINQFRLNSGYEKTNIDSIKDTLQNLICKNELGILEFSFVLSALDVKIELLMDGYDEVSMGDTDLALEVIRTIHTIKSIRLWITTRTQYLEELETELGVLGYKIKEFNEDDQVEFLISHWKHSDAARNESRFNVDKLILYAKKVLRSAKSKLNKDDNDIAGMPLQCLLIGEVYEEESIGFASRNSGSECLPTIRINSISHLYENMITKKFKKYIQTHVTTEFAGMDNLICAHVDLSFKLLFSNYHPKLDFVKVDPKDLLNIGIVQTSSTPGNTDFIHRTFAEYFIAGYVVEQILGRSELESEFASLFLGEILMRKVYFLQILPEMERLASYKFVHDVIGYFVNDCISEAVTTPMIGRFFIEKEKTRKEISHACVNNSFLQIYKLFFSKSNSGLDETIIYLALHNSSFEYCTFLLSSFDKNVYSFDKNVSSFDEAHLSNFLRVAVQRSEPSIVKFLVRRQPFRELIDNLNDSTKLLLHDCVSNTKNKLDDDIEKRVGVIKLLFEISPHLLEERDGCERTPLLCQYVHVDLLKELLRSGADTISQDMMGDTVLHLTRNQFRRLKANEYHSLITSMDASMLTQVANIIANDGQTPLMRLLCVLDPIEETIYILQSEKANHREIVLCLAIGSGRNLATLKSLIKFGVNLTWKGNDGESYLHIASFRGNLNAVQLLLEDYDFDVNIKDDELQTPMDYIIKSKQNNRFETARILYNFGGRTSEQANFQHLLYQAIKDGNAQSVRIIKEILIPGNGNLVESGISRVSNSSQQIYLSEEKFKLLVKDFVETKELVYKDTDGNSLLHLAANRGDELAVKELVENGADLDDRDVGGNTPLHLACFCFDLTIGLRIIKYLIDNGAKGYSKNERNSTFFHLLVIRGRYGLISETQLHEITKYLAEKNLINLLFSSPSGPYGFTPCQLACQLLELTEETVMLLNQEGVSFNQLNNLQQNAFICSIIGGRSKAFINLIINECNANWKQQDKYGNNGLHYAVHFGNLDALKLLLDFGLDINHVNKNGSTALHWLAMSNTKEIVEIAKILTEKEIDIMKKNYDGYTALELFLGRHDNNQFNSEIRTEFAKALQIRDVDLVQANFMKSAEQNVKLLLHEAVDVVGESYDCLSVIKSIIPTETDVYAKDHHGHTFLHEFLTSKKPSPSYLHRILKYLLDIGHKRIFEVPGGKEGASVLHLIVKYFEPKRETLQLLKSQGINFNRVDDKRNSLLVYAINGQRSYEFLSRLVNEFEVSWRRTNIYKHNLLHTAAQMGHEDAVTHFAGLGLNINSKDLTGSTPLHHAIRFGNNNILKMLQVFLDNRAEVNAKNDDGQTPLHCTAFIRNQSNILPVVQLLIENGADAFAVDNNKYTFLHLLTTDFCSLEPVIFQQLIQYLVDHDYFKLIHTPGGEIAITPAHLSVRNLKLRKQTLTILYPTIYAINYTDNRGYSSLSYAVIGKQSREFCQHLVDFGAETNQKTSDNFGQSLLHISSRFGIPEVVELFVDLGLDVNGKDNFARTPLHLSAFRQDKDTAIEVIKCLIKNGADIDSVDCDGNSPLYVAVAQSTQSLALIKCFVHNGPNTFSVNFHNTKIIHVAAQIGGVEVLKFFLDMKSFDINSIDGDGDTPLHCAMGQKESDYVLEKVQMILGNGADVKMKNKKGQTALNIAEERDEWDDKVKDKLVRLLMQS